MKKLSSTLCRLSSNLTTRPSSPIAVAKNLSMEDICRGKSILYLLRNKDIDEAHRIFLQIPSADIHLYTMMINRFSQANRIGDALQLFDSMPRRDIPCWNSMIKSCIDCGYLCLAQKLFAEMPERNVISWTTIVSGLAKFGCIDAAEKLFNTMPDRDTAAWNSMITGYCENGRVHDAQLLFEKMPHRNVISWTAMIGAYAQIDDSNKALCLFQQMWVRGIKPTSSTFACALTACANSTDSDLGIQIHATVIKTGYDEENFTLTSLINFYANCEQIESSSKLFEEVENRNVVLWTALITGYGLNGRHEEALDEFYKMVRSGIMPNQSTFSSSLSSCCGLEALDRGKRIHAAVIKQGFDLDVFVGNSLVVMYSKCGDVTDCLKIFNNMSIRNLVSWNSIIVGCAQNGYASQALEFFDQMSAFHVKPDEITFVGLLNACSHSRMIGKGRQIFQMLKENPSVDVRAEHYACMVDILGRSGNLEEAEEFIGSMPMKPNVMVWLALLSACRVHCNVEIAQKAAGEIFYLDPYNSAAYVLLSNIYASAGRWNDVAQTRMMMRSHGIVKIQGSSWITVNETRYEFVCGDRSNPLSTEIDKKLDWLDEKLKEYGYICEKTFALHDVDDEQKEYSLKYHSEKLAVAFGLLVTANGSTVRVMKNLRVCGDCHAAIKLISMIVGREIVLRDSSRFHHFRDGLCSCGDYW
ncbi:pentatricopeptide repeat-containing protein At5g46460, mitochondrial [Phalaenopsis equestris]|uniref:pentatricopeptide repeat-containing protein At5g46460, mitochondrial n=1 Tax=Phalaenopsis equestris TaxID=78828 RepID=UPI0009E2E2FA|nr:pentatricopeptide repeat-containing protein At5g46460, mitochondrial [Phalaenopsis equestris]